MSTFDDDGQQTYGPYDEDNILGPAFAAAAMHLVRQAKRFGERFRLHRSGALVDTASYNSMRDNWAAPLPQHPPVHDDS